jgi:hypothetical protein
MRQTSESKLSTTLTGPLLTGCATVSALRRLPSQYNFAGLAHILWVPERDLLPDSADNGPVRAVSLAVVIEARTAQIAGLAGTTQDKVRVTIEF